MQSSGSTGTGERVVIGAFSEVGVGAVVAGTFSEVGVGVVVTGTDFAEVGLTVNVPLIGTNRSKPDSDKKNNHVPSERF